MFEHMKRFPVILVTGPLRSGTTICGHMIAHDTGHRYVDETDWGDVDWERFRETIGTRDDIVVQCPGVMHRLHEEGVGDQQDILIVVMLRSAIQCADSLKKRDRRGEWAKRESLGYFDPPGTADYNYTVITKYAYWLGPQALEVRNWEAVVYDNLKNHPLWVPPEERVGWKVKQWRKETP